MPRNYMKFSGIQQRGSTTRYKRAYLLFRDKNNKPDIVPLNFHKKGRALFFKRRK